jgi:hypothetical protein
MKLNGMAAPSRAAQEPPQGKIIANKTVEAWDGKQRGVRRPESAWEKAKAKLLECPH